MFRLMQMSRIVLGLSAIIFLVARAPALELRVENRSVERFQQVVSQPLSKSQEADIAAKALVETTDGSVRDRIPFVVDKSRKTPVLVWLMPGITPAGQVRTFAFREPGPELPPSADSDLAVSTDEKSITVENSYFSVRHPREGGGGFPQDITLRLSGNKDAALYFLDRLYRRENRKQYLAKNDPNARARVVFKSPLRIVIEAEFSYVLSGKNAPGNPRAIYRYTYTPHSPLVEISAIMQQDEDALWNELHFLHLSRGDYHYTSFVYGDPPTEAPMQTPGEKSRAYSAKWAVMCTDTDAVGVGLGSVQCWDASDEFVYYISRTRPQWNSTEKRMDGGLYLGPASSDPSWYGRWLGAGQAPKVEVIDAAPQTDENDTLLAGKYELRNDALHIAFADEAQGYDCLGIRNLLAGGARFITARPQVPGLWMLEFQKPFSKTEDGSQLPDPLEITNRTPCQRSAKITQADGNSTLRMTWKGISIGDEPGVLDVSVSVTLLGKAGPSEWRIEIDNRSSTYGLWQSHFPYLATVSPRGTADVLHPRGNWGGTLRRKSQAALKAPYPSAACPVQFMAFNRDEAGLYLAAHDGGARAKELVITADQDATFVTYAEDMGVPGSDVAAPFPFIVAAYKGDWWQSVRIYRKWATQQVWTRKGWIRDRDDIPLRFKEMGLWMLLSGGVESVVPAMLKVDELSDVPVGVHWYNWHQIPFDNSYPNYFPTKEGFTEATHQLTAKGQLIMPYINGRLWDQDIPSFPAQAISGACKQPSGEVYTEIYGSGRRLSPMCPTTKIWQDKVNEICKRLMEECGVNGIYLDQIGAARPRICFDPKHGHPLGGGRHWVDSYRDMLNRTKALAVKNHVTLTTENTAEPYMDNIDGYLAWVQRDDTDVPLLPAVYSGYTIYFTSPEDAKDDLDAFCMAQGRDFLWGCQLGWNGSWILDPAHRDKLEFQLELCRIRLAAKSFMVYGQLLDEIRPTEPPPMTTTWNRRKSHAATLPAVQGTLWRSAGNQLGVFIVNYSSQPQLYTFRLEPNQWLQNGGTGRWLLSRITGQGSAPWRVADGDVIDQEEFLLPHQILAFRVEALTDPAAALADAETAARRTGLLAQSAEQFLFARELNEMGLTIQAPAPIQRLVRGEPAELKFHISNVSSQERVLTVTWPDQPVTDIAIPPKTSRDLRQVLWLQANGTTASASVVLAVQGSGRAHTYTVRFRISDAIQVQLGSTVGARGGENILLPVDVRNNSRVNRHGRLYLDVPSDWHVEPGRTLDLGDMSSGARRSFLFRCGIPHREQATQTTINAYVVESRSSRELFIRESRPRMEAPRLNEVPTVDGQLTEWDAMEPLIIGPANKQQVKISKSYTGEQDCSAKVWCGWDETNLFFAAQVTDDAQFQEETTETIWRGDCIQLAFHDGALNPKQNFDGRERELGLTLGPNGPLVFQWMPDRQPLKNVPLSVRRTDTTTIYEAAIPWKVLGIEKGVPGKRLSWSLTVNDNDGAGFEGWLEWTPGVCGGKDSSAFGWLELLPN